MAAHEPLRLISKLQWLKEAAGIGVAWVLPVGALVRRWQPWRTSGAPWRHTCWPRKPSQRPVGMQNARCFKIRHRALRPSTDRHQRVRHSFQKKALNLKGTRSTARRVTLKTAVRQAGRFPGGRAAENHAIRKLFVQDAVEMPAGICFKDLTGMCGRTIVPKALAGTSRSFFQLRMFTASKAATGSPVEIVQPHDTSHSSSRGGRPGPRRAGLGL